MPLEEVKIGPFIEGLNTFSDPTAVSDRQLVVCENFELDLDGSLVSRPPVTSLGVNFPLGATGNVIMLGYFYGPGGIGYLIASNGLNSTYYFTGSSWTLLTNTFAASAMVQFDDKAWLMAPVGSANPGGYWTPTGGFTAQPNMPKGDVIVAMKSRLWVAGGKNSAINGTRMYFSKVLGQPDFWQVAPDFIQIGSGDGENIVQMSTYYQSLLIFRTDSIYSFQYTTDPTNATVSLVVPGVGLASRDALVGYENYFYFTHRDRAYEFINNRIQQINVEVPFRSGSRVGLYQPYAVSLFNKRIMFTYWDVTYVYSLQTRTWCIWKSTVNGPLGRMVEVRGDGLQPEAVLFSSRMVPTTGTRVAQTLRVQDGAGTATEQMTCIAQTKVFDYESSAAYKKLAWWGVDATFRGLVKGVAAPITFNARVTWGELKSKYSWKSVKDYTWGQPGVATTSVETVRNTAGVGATKKFAKFGRALRFRQIYFRITFDTDGSSATAPVRLFSITSYVRRKETVAKAIT